MDRIPLKTCQDCNRVTVADNPHVCPVETTRRVMLRAELDARNPRRPWWKKFLSGLATKAAA